MKRIASLLLFLPVLISSCKSWDPSMIAASKQPISQKLLKLEGNLDNNTGTSEGREHELKIFNKELEENFIDQNGQKYGQINLVQEKVKLKKGIGYSMFTGMLLMAPSAVGFPLQRFKYTTEVCVTITDSKNNVIGEYGATGKAVVPVAFYYGYSEEDAPRKVYSDAMQDALSQIKSFIQADAARLNKQLTEAGAVE